MLSASPLLLLTPSDLLLTTIYNPVAVDYFTTIDSYLAAQQSPVRPSNGHIAVSNQMIASQYGPVVSIWPVDK